MERLQRELLINPSCEWKVERSTRQRVHRPVAPVRFFAFSPAIWFNRDDSLNRCCVQWQCNSCCGKVAVEYFLTYRPSVTRSPNETDKADVFYVAARKVTIVRRCIRQFRVRSARPSTTSRVYTLARVQQQGASSVYRWKYENSLEIPVTRCSMRDVFERDDSSGRIDLARSATHATANAGN